MRTALAPNERNVRLRWPVLGMSAVLAANALGAPNMEEVIFRESPGRMYEKQGSVLYQRANSEVDAFPPQALEFGDALRTLSLSRAAIRLSDRSQLHMRELTRLEIQRRPANTNAPLVRIQQGQVLLSSRVSSADVLVETPHASGRPRGTEFLVVVDSNRTEFTMFDGEVELSSGAETQPVRSGQQGIVVPGQPIRVRPILQATNIVQWWIDYPGVLDPAELGLSANEEMVLADSLSAYRAGELQRALEKFPGYPATGNPTTDAQRCYLAALCLAVGSVDRTLDQLSRVSQSNPQEVALQTVITAVSGRPAGPRDEGGRNAVSASELLARSYQHQAAHDLRQALVDARAAVAKSPAFGFGWARVAELEFGFGQTRAARRAVERALQVTPRNAQAWTLHGFLLAAENRIPEAIVAFNQAIEIDSGLANAWLGRGLCKCRLGWFQPKSGQGWQEDLQAAAGLEPNRSILRSYAGKAFVDTGNARLAEKELSYAHKLDPNDPRPLLFLALLNQQRNRINEAVTELQAAKNLNDNRGLFRSRLLLDQDRAVSSVNLASIYRDAGMNDVSVREAALAVTYDYANPAAHLFVSDSFNDQRDPTRFNLRYESVWFGEYLLANLLSPVGGGRLSQHVSQQEYSKLMEADRVGLANTTVARSDGQVHELVSQYGVVRNSAWSFDLDYQHNDGTRPNNELSRLEWHTTLKQQLTPQDSALMLIKYQNYQAGDNFQYYEPTNARPNFQFDENQEPILVGAYHHEWAPGIHSLVLGGRLVNDQQVSDLAAPQLLLLENPSGEIEFSDAQPFDVNYHSQLEIYTGEFNQVVQGERVTLVAGARGQSGWLNTGAALYNPPAGVAGLFNEPAAYLETSDNFSRVVGYAYLTVEPVERLWLTAGLAYDTVTMPRNHRQPPIQSGTETQSQLGPKAALVWSPLTAITVRGLYARSLGGVSLDESYRLEPTQLAGFPQTFRTIISETVAGSVAAPTHDIGNLALDLTLTPRTFAGVEFGWMKSTVERDIGVFWLRDSVAPFVPGPTRENLDYRERGVGASVHQLIGNEFVAGVRYRFTQVDLQTTLPEVPTTALASANRDESANLHVLGSYLLFNHPCGFFARIDGHWYCQDNAGYAPPLPGDSFFQWNVFIGYRFLNRRAQIIFGVLNLNNQDYRLNPLTVYSELPRQRTFMGGVSFQF